MDREFTNTKFHQAIFMTQTLTSAGQMLAKALSFAIPRPAVPYTWQLRGLFTLLSPQPRTPIE